MSTSCLTATWTKWWWRNSLESDRCVLACGASPSFPLLWLTSFLPDSREEGWIIPQTYDGKTSGLCCKICYLPRHVHRNQRDRNTSGTSCLLQGLMSTIIVIHAGRSCSRTWSGTSCFSSNVRAFCSSEDTQGSSPDPCNRAATN